VPSRGTGNPPGDVEEQDMSRITLMAKDGEGMREATDAEIVVAAREVLGRRFRRGAALTSPKVAREYLAMKYALHEREVFVAIWLDTRHRVLGHTELFHGTIDGASVHPREVVKEALRQNASACLISHNHPSAVAEPSRADEAITQRLKAALELVDIRLVDHLITAGGTCVSLAERGVL
jgi:DNA repair protein RadC